jgi:phosphopantothenoylcysteine decarboxylase/phosphopantothenate--cysteine ligase
MRGKKILLGVSGSIAAYKSAILVRLLVKAGAEVKVIMTPSAKDFITPLTLATLSKNPVGCNYFNAENGEWNSHVEYGLWADVMVIAPASANTLSKMANGACDNLLIASYLSAKCPVFFAPAMDLDMYQHPSTKENISKLLSYGNRMIAPTDGELASGLFGEGRMEEAEKIVQVLSDFFLNAQPLKGKKALVSAGPTYEAIDPVRFIGNRSSGKMGYAIAEELSRQGAEVVLVSGPTALSHPLGVKVVKVESAAEMKAACMDNYAKMDVVVMAAAVADFKPAQSAEQKIKKKNSELDLSLVPTEDILKAMGEKKTTQFLVGFALESENELSNAKDKLSRKNLDMIVMNSIRDNGAGFNHDTNQITVINSKGQEKTFPLKSKKDVAKDLIEIIVSSLKK